MAYRLRAAYRDRLLHVHGLGWHSWDGTRWAADDTGTAKRAVLDVLRCSLADSLGDKQLQQDVRRCESDSGINGVLGIASALIPFAATVRDLDADPYLLNTANGTLDLRTLTMSPHRPADRITKVCRGAYRPDAESPLWTSFLARVLPDADVRGFLHRLVGVGLLGAVREHVLPILTGVGANGKGTFYEAVLHALGDYASTAEPDLFMHREGAHPTGEMDLMGRRLVVVSESERNRRLAEATMKRLTGGDPIRARRMRQDFVQFDPSHLPMLITNHLPKVSGDDAAVWRRLRVVPFDVVIPEYERDGDLGERLQLEADGILGWAIAGWRDYNDRGSLDEPSAVLAATDAYQVASDAVRRFIDEECVVSSPALKATTSQLHEAFERWRVRDGAEPMSQRSFGLSLDRHGYTADKAVHGKRWRTGIALRATEEEQ
ncbi:DNA primase family protein [Mycobacterium paraintracellulare]|uniref:DNA primase family protein n=1 Tax=Mycobacterium paraintracellulare TaxID=1138383 RepID=UPI00192953B8|nr:phage/plasmid primase, P4 family [Mycobacterium paraintracellulare]